MSEWASIIGALEGLVRTAIPAIPAAALGFEQGIRPGTDLRAAELPHCFAHDPTETATELDWMQQEVQFAVQLSFWAAGPDTVQETMNGYLDAVRDAVRGDPTLGGLVDFAWCATRGTLDQPIPGRNEKAGVVIVRTRTVVR
jgi:hypothetical protein